MSADPNGERWTLDNSAAGTTPTPLPLKVETGTSPRAPYFQFLIWPVELPLRPPGKQSKPKDLWLEKQMGRRGWKK